VSDNSFRHVPALDGVRAVAVLLVIVEHTRLGLISGGYLGVEIFFVLSGYLITSILLREQVATGRISLFNFYMRRALRILPALILLLLVYALVGSLLAIDPNVIQRDVFAAASFAANWFRAFDLKLALYFQHTWSLAIEEQFYLVWPALLILVFRGSMSRHLLALILACAVSVMLWRAAMYFDGASHLRIYNGFDTRADALLLGVAAAVFQQYSASDRKDRLLDALAKFAIPLSAIFLAAAVFSISSSRWMILAGYSLVTLYAAIIILLICNDKVPMLSRCLEWRPLRYVGRISYGLYLWHFVVLNIMWHQLGADSLVLATLGLALTFACAALSYHLLERPALRMKARFSAIRAGDRLVAQPAAGPQVASISRRRR
jgi:peptidoglycan/LPS O-acetylase OafA/YrhL